MRNSCPLPLPSALCPVPCRPSEHVLQCELQNPRITRRRQLAERARGDVEIRRRRVVPLEPVEGVERFDAELEALLTEHPEHAAEREVDVLRADAFDAVALH